MTFVGGAGKMVKRKIELVKEVFIDLMKNIDMLLRSPLGHICAERYGNAILVRSADIEDVFTLEPFKAGIAIRWKIGARNMPKMELSIGIGSGGCDENLIGLLHLLLLQPYLKLPVALECKEWDSFGSL